jgi:hypothetical protein
MTARHAALTCISATLLLGDEDEDEAVMLTPFVQDGHVVLALADQDPDDPSVAELDPLVLLNLRCAEALAREILRVVDEERNGVRAVVGEG